MVQAYQNLDLGPRVGWFLRTAYPGARAKRIANQFGVSETTAKRWMSGVTPTSEHLQAMAKEWGWRFVQFVYQPVCGGGSFDEAMSADLRAMEARLARLEARENAGIRAVPGAPDDGVAPAASPLVGKHPRQDEVARRRAGGAR